MSQQNVNKPLFRVRGAGRQSHWPLISEEHDSGGEVDLVAAGNDVYYDDVNDYDYDHHGDDNHGYEYDYGKLVNTHNTVSTNEIRTQRNGVRFFPHNFCMYFHERELRQFDFNFIECCSECCNENKSPLIQVLAWHRTDDTLSPEVVVTQFTSVYIRHQESVELYWI